MRGRLSVTGVLVLGTFVLAPLAHADHTSVHATAGGAMATTDNLFGAGSDGNRQADIFFTVRPGVLYAYDAPSMRHDFTAEAEFVEYMFHGDRPIALGRAGWKSSFFTSPRTLLTMSIDTGTGLLSLLTARSSSDQTTAGVVPSGEVDVQEAGASESFSWVAGKQTRVSQGVSGRYGFTDDGAGTTTDARTVSVNLGLERTFRRDSVSMGAELSYLKLERIAPAGAMLGSRLDDQLNPRATLSWRHELGKRYSTSFEGGLVIVRPVGTDKYNPGAVRRGGTFGTFGAQLAYTELWGRASLSARRNISPNLFLAQNTIEDAANLQVALPLPWLDATRRNPKLAALGSLGVARTQLLDAETGSTRGDFGVVHLDLSVGWSPSPGMTYGVRYELMVQTGDGAAEMAVPGYYRNTLYFTFAVRYPARVIGEAPRQRKDLRSKDDRMPVGVDPVMIDVIEESEDDGGGR